MVTQTPDQALAVVTGTSSGIGADTARRLARTGLHVLAGVRRLDDAPTGPGIEPVLLDVTSADDIRALAARVSADARPLRALVNNAGISVNAPVETLPLEEWRRQLEVNFLGSVAVIQALLPALVDARGRIVNVSSVGGRVALPAYGAYAASKFAVEAMSDALRREVGGLGVQVVVVEPGTVRTDIWSKGLDGLRQMLDAMTSAQRARYEPLMTAMARNAESSSGGIHGGVLPTVAADTILEAVTAARPRTRYTVGRDAAVLARLARLLPDRALDRLLRRALGLPGARTTAVSSSAGAPVS